ncbi:hypothetical protein [Aeromicrobium sp. Root472D3]|uniref:hypothetical protein n=1 Tax=Aeromicrobium sp. Root472D3 TaxID=1736540 RepID=UPI0006F3F010|nr:hypothetical protein [Aeromicrobium sp. Root472D3]KQX75634.1 hypothetical protein ASD10_10875 [Aeromicrobium sp. Root472D3]
MSAEVWILVATAVLAVVAIGAAVVAVRAVRQMSRAAVATPAVDAPAAPAQQPDTTRPRAVVVHEDVATVAPVGLEPRIVQGRLVVPPTQHQVVQAALGRPGVRLSIVAHGLAHALRPESRDRISALMRREFRRRRRERQQAGRRAVRAAQPAPPAAPSDPWLGS